MCALHWPLPKTHRFVGTAVSLLPQQVLLPDFSMRRTWTWTAAGSGRCQQQCSCSWVGVMQQTGARRHYV